MKNDEENLYSKEMLETMHKLGSVFQKIHNRLTKEGYKIKDGVLYRPDGSVEYGRPIEK